MWMVVPRRLLTELSQENNEYIQQGSKFTLRYMDDYTCTSLFKQTLKDVKYEYILKMLHIEMFTIYTVYLYNISIWAIVMCVCF